VIGVIAAKRSIHLPLPSPTRTNLAASLSPGHAHGLPHNLLAQMTQYQVRQRRSEQWVRPIAGGGTTRQLLGGSRRELRTAAPTQAGTTGGKLRSFFTLAPTSGRWRHAHCPKSACQADTTAACDLANHLDIHDAMPKSSCARGQGNTRSSALTTLLNIGSGRIECTFQGGPAVRECRLCDPMSQCPCGNGIRACVLTGACALSNNDPNLQLHACI
jgi:hypothetical protein